MSRLLSFRALAALVLCLGAITAAIALAEEGKSSSVVATIDLKDQLEKALKARRPVEFEFIGLVVERVDSGELPRDLVQSSFLWARRKPYNKIQYFEQSLRLRAKRKGIAFDTDGVTSLAVKK